MPTTVKPIPKGYHSITPSLTCRDAARAIDFYKQVFDAQELSRMSAPDGKITHAELKIGDSVLFLNDEFPETGSRQTESSSIYLYLYVTDVDSVFNRAAAAGARTDMPLQDMFWGDRYGKLTDPFGHQWGVATRKENVAPEEVSRRAAAFFAKAAGHSAASAG